MMARAATRDQRRPALDVGDVAAAGAAIGDRRVASPIARRPWTHGPHWPALSAAMNAMISAVAVTPQPSVGRSPTIPQPNVSPRSVHHRRVEGHVPDVADAAPTCRNSRRGRRPRSGAASPPAAKHLAERRAELDLADALGRHGTGDRDERRPAGRAAAGRSVPVVAAAGDQRRIGQALHVLDERRGAADAGSDMRGGVVVGRASPVVDVVDGRRRLARDIADRRLDEPDPTPELVTPAPRRPDRSPRPRPRAPDRRRRRPRRRRRLRRPGSPHR